MHSGCQTVWIQFRPDILTGLQNIRPGLGPNCLQKLAADDTKWTKNFKNVNKIMLNIINTILFSMNNFLQK